MCSVQGASAKSDQGLPLPVPTWTALCILDEAGAFTDLMVTQACEYLRSITTAEGGVPSALSSVRDYPHAPWWETADQPFASLNPTAAIAALLHKHRVEHPWLTVATEYCWQQLDTMEQTTPYEMRAVLPFLEYVSDRERAGQVFARVGPKILEQKLVTLHPTIEEETHSPLNFAPHPHFCKFRWSMRKFGNSVGLARIW